MAGRVMVDDYGGMSGAAPAPMGPEMLAMLRGRAMAEALRGGRQGQPAGMDQARMMALVQALRGSGGRSKLPLQPL